MANEVSKSNLLVAGFIAAFGCPAMCVGVPTSFFPRALTVTQSVTCPAGSHMTTSEHSDIGFNGRRQIIVASCVDARGQVVAEDVYAQSFGVLYAIAWVGMVGTAAYVLRAKPESPNA